MKSFCLIMVKYHSKQQYIILFSENFISGVYVKILWRQIINFSDWQRLLAGTVEGKLGLVSVLLAGEDFVHLIRREAVSC